MSSRNSPEVLPGAPLVELAGVLEDDVEELGDDDDDGSGVDGGGLLVLVLDEPEEVISI